MSMTDEELYAVLSKLPDFDRYPIPESWYAKFNIPKPKILTMMESFTLARASADAPGPNVKTEFRPRAEGGVRPLINVEVPTLECTPVVDEPETAEDTKGK